MTRRGAARKDHAKHYWQELLTFNHLIGMVSEGANRRDILVAIGAGLVGAGTSAGAPPADKGEIPYRTLGHTGEKVSCIGMGGFHLGKPQVTEADAIKLVHSGVDRGINFLDNSWDYNKGESESASARRSKMETCAAACS